MIFLDEMTSSVSSPDPSVNSDRSSAMRKRKKKSGKESQNQAENLQGVSPVHWKSEVQQQIYTSKLVQALQHARRGASGEQTPPAKRVREAANRVLAATAKGRSRWSGAILTNQLKLKFLKKNSAAKRQRRLMTVITTNRSPQKSKVNVSRLKSRGLPAFQRKARLLGRLIPGCRKQPVHVVLEEAMDYIPALEMQVRAMSSLVERLSSSTTGSSSSATLLFSQPGSSQTPPN